MSNKLKLLALIMLGILSYGCSELEEAQKELDKLKNYPYPEACEEIKEEILSVLETLNPCAEFFPSPEICEEYTTEFEFIPELGEPDKWTVKHDQGRVVESFSYYGQCYEYRIIVIDGIVQKVIDISTLETL